MSSLHFKVYQIVLCIILLGSLSAIGQTQYSTKNKKALELYFEADNFRVRGDYDRAIDLLKDAISKDKNFEEAYFRLGVTYKNKEDIQSSIENYEKGLSLTKDSKRQNGYRFELADNYLRIGNYPPEIGRAHV